MMTKKCQIILSQKGWCNELIKLQFESILSTGYFDARTNQPKSIGSTQQVVEEEKEKV